MDCFLANLALQKVVAATEAVAEQATLVLQTTLVAVQAADAILLIHLLQCRVVVTVVARVPARLRAQAHWLERQTVAASCLEIASSEIASSETAYSAVVADANSVVADANSVVADAASEPVAMVADVELAVASPICEVPISIPTVDRFHTQLRHLVLEQEWLLRTPIPTTRLVDHGTS